MNFVPQSELSSLYEGRYRRSIGTFPSKIGMKSAYDTPALRRSALILDAVASSPTSLVAADFSKKLDLPKSTTHGLLLTMQELGLLKKATDGTYQIGQKIMHWAHAFLNQTNLVQEFQHVMLDYSDLDDHTITLSVLDGNNVVYLSCRNSRGPLGFTFKMGMHLPAAFTATGKIMLSALTDEEIRLRFDHEWPEKMTNRSVSNIDQLLTEIHQIRKSEISFDNGQIREGMFCLGVGIRDFSNQVIAGLALSLIESEATESNIDRVISTLRKISVDLSERLGAPRMNMHPDD